MGIIATFAASKHFGMKKTLLTIVFAFIGIITAGNCYNYAKETFGNTASYFKLGLLNPLPKAGMSRA